MYLFATPCRVIKTHLDDFLLNVLSCFRRLLVRSSALVTKLKTFCSSLDPLVAGLSADFVLPAQVADRFPALHDLCHKLFSLFHNSLCLPRHLTHFLCLSDAFIVAKTVTYVSSLTVTYVTTLYIVSSRQLAKLSVWLNGMMSDTVRIRLTRFLVFG